VCVCVCVCVCAGLFCFPRAVYIAKTSVYPKKQVKRAKFQRMSERMSTAISDADASTKEEPKINQ